jgi:hypothetical protein
MVARNPNFLQTLPLTREKNKLRRLKEDADSLEQLGLYFFWHRRCLK